MPGERDRNCLLATMQPSLSGERFVFVPIDKGSEALSIRRALSAQAQIGEPVAPVY